MGKEPYVGAYIDEEERELIEAINEAVSVPGYVPGPSSLTPESLKELQEAARFTLNEIREKNEQRTKISLRVTNYDLERLKARAKREGMPYQTLINSILHKAVAG